ncbi:MAG: hypothetical protein HWE23_13260 [Rhodobacteraceae bacterium]|nr:hypothetical protein [Paracoccaceae bacterium]
MLRVVVAHLLLFCVPFLAYAGWLFLRNRGLDKATWREAPNAWLALIGMALVIVSVIWFANIKKMPEGGEYHHSRMEDGVFIPGGYD